MALKRKVTKAEYAALSPAIQAEYKADGEDFLLNAEGFDDPGELRRAKEREVQARKDAEQQVKDLTAKLATITDTDARRAGDVATLEKSWAVKLAKQKEESEAALKKATEFLQATLVDGVANQLAAELGGENAVLLLPHIKSRLTADTTGDRPLTRVLDKDGKPSAFSVEDLKKEIAGDSRFKAVVVASKASGGGAAGGGAGRPNGGAGNGQKKFGELSDTERLEWYKRDPTEFVKASNAYKDEQRDARMHPARVAV